MKRKFLSGKTWFFEGFVPGEQKLSTWGVVIEKEIYSGKSQFQKIEIFKTKEFGRILVLDDIIQLSTRQEFIYHEMLVQPALFYHPNPKKVLIIGGGDGGALREVAKHPVEEIFLVDIDQKIIEISKKYLPSLSQGAFADKRLRIFNENGLNFIKNYHNFFDVIISDSTDPLGPSKGLWGISYYQKIARALKKEGIAAFQTAYFSDWFSQKARERIKKIFPFFKIHQAFVECFPFGAHTFSFASFKINFDKISYKKIKEKFKKLNLQTKYYSPEIHFASGVLPKYLT